MFINSLVVSLHVSTDLLTEEGEGPEESGTGAVEGNMYSQILGMSGVSFDGVAIL